MESGRIGRPSPEHCPDGQPGSTTIDLLPCGVLVAGPDGDATSVNRGWAAATGQRGPAWRGRGWLDIAEADEREARRDDLLATVRSGARYDEDWPVHDGARGPRTLHVRAVPELVEGKLERFVVTVDDVTAERADHTRRDDGRDGLALLMAAARRLRLPITTIAGLAADLHDRRDRLTAAEIDAAVATLHRRAQRLVAVLDELPEVRPTVIPNPEFRLVPIDRGEGQAPAPPSPRRRPGAPLAPERPAGTRRRVVRRAEPWLRVARSEDEPSDRWPSSRPRDLGGGRRG